MVWSSVWNGLPIAIKTTVEKPREVTKDEALEELQWEAGVYRYLRSWEGMVRVRSLLYCEPRHDCGTVGFYRSPHGMVRQHVGCDMV